MLYGAGEARTRKRPPLRSVLSAHAPARRRHDPAGASTPKSVTAVKSYWVKLARRDRGVRGARTSCCRAHWLRAAPGEPKLLQRATYLEYGVRSLRGRPAATATKGTNGRENLGSPGASCRRSWQNSLVKSVNQRHPNCFFKSSRVFVHLPQSYTSKLMYIYRTSRYGVFPPGFTFSQAWR